MTWIKKLIVIPARYASTRFPGKMLAQIHSKTLIQHTFENAKKSKRIEDILIATDDKRIFDHAKSFGAQVVMTSSNCPNGTARAYQALKQFKRATNDAIIINIQGDEPTLNPEAIDKLYDMMAADPKINMATLVTPILDSEHFQDPSVVKCVFNTQHQALYFSRAAIPHPRHQRKAYQHLGVYAFRKSFLQIYHDLPHTPLQDLEDLEQLKVLEHGYSIKVLIDNNPAIGVDHPEDINKVKKYLCR